MGTIIIGSSANRKGITIIPSKVLFNGNNVKNIMSGLAEIWSDAKALVPTMTSNTTPSGVASANAEYSSRYAWYAFNNNNSNFWGSNATTGWLQYKFDNPTNVKKFDILGGDCGGKVVLKGSNDGSSWTDLCTKKDFLSGSDISNEVATIHIDNKNYYLYYRAEISDTVPSSFYASVKKLQFYGSQVFGLVPTMSSNVGINGEASAKTEYYATTNNNAHAFRAFDGNDATNWLSDSLNAEEWIKYHFNKPTCVKYISLKNSSTRNTYVIKTLKVQGSNDDSQWTDITDVLTNTNVATGGVNSYALNNSTEYLYYRVVFLTGVGTQHKELASLQFYGDEKYQVKGLVPVMTSNTAPYGEASAYSTNGQDAYLAFDGDTSTAYHSSGFASGKEYLQYKFTVPTRVNAMYVANRIYSSSTVNSPKDMILQGSSDGSAWDDIFTTTNTDNASGASRSYRFENAEYYLYYRLLCTTTNNTSLSIGELQFYGEQLEALIPTMTSNTTPYGEVVSNTAFYADNPAWKAFCGNTTSFAWVTGSPEIKYKFNKSATINAIKMSVGRSGTSSVTFKLVALIDGSWIDVDAEEITVVNNGYVFTETFVKLDSEIKCDGFGIVGTSAGSGNWNSGNEGTKIANIQFYK